MVTFDAIFLSKVAIRDWNLALSLYPPALPTRFPCPCIFPHSHICSTCTLHRWSCCHVTRLYQGHVPPRTVTHVSYLSLSSTPITQFTDQRSGRCRIEDSAFWSWGFHMVFHTVQVPTYRREIENLVVSLLEFAHVKKFGYDILVLKRSISIVNSGLSQKLIPKVRSTSNTFSVGSVIERQVQIFCHQDIPIPDHGLARHFSAVSMFPQSVDQNAASSAGPHRQRLETCQRSLVCAMSTCNCATTLQMWQTCSINPSSLSSILPVASCSAYIAFFVGVQRKKDQNSCWESSSTAWRRFWTCDNFGPLFRTYFSVILLVRSNIYFLLQVSIQKSTSARDQALYG